MGQLIIVSNRLPVSVHSDGPRQCTVTRSMGGLATGLSGLHERMRCEWIGWPGDVGMLGDEQRRDIDAKLAKLRAVPVYLTQEEIESYYGGFSNGVLWPLFHYLLDRLPYEPQNWEIYRRVNQRFADAVCSRYRDGDLIWVHDYHLALVPQLVRDRLPGARIGYFLHIPFPASAVFRILPWRQELLLGLLGADLIGMHTISYVREFSSALMCVLGLAPKIDRVEHEGRTTRFGAFPMGVDAAFFEQAAGTAETLAAVETIRRDHKDAKILLGVDRLDYTKGIPRRLLAIERLLQLRPELVGKLCFIQVAVPSRTNVKEYEAFSDHVHQLVGRINGVFSTASSVPIHFIYRGFSQSDLVALYRAADVMIVTPLRDGMNLVAKEFVASRPDEDGVLVLSELAGAASELGEALIVNPYDIEGVAQALARALELPATQRKKRMKAMRERVMHYDVHRWSRSFIYSLARVPAHLPAHDSAKVADILLRLLDQEEDRDKRLLLLLDYDGTLVPFAVRPELAEPDGELLRILGALCDRPHTEVHIVSGRSHETLGEWFDGLGLALHAEHGMWSKAPGDSWRRNMDIDVRWKGRVREILEQFTTLLPGSFIEEKTASLGWHYRGCDPDYAQWQAKELKVHLAHVLGNTPLELLAGDKVIEIQPHGVNKGVIVQKLRADDGQTLMLALGDDASDELMFAALPPEGISVHVGPRPSHARYRLSDHAEARELLRRLLLEVPREAR